MKFLSLLLPFFICKISCAQTYHAFPDSNANWNVEQTVSWYQNGTNILERHFYGWKYVLGTDTILSGQTYHKIGTEDLWSYETIDGNPLLLHNDSLIAPDYFGGIREDSDKKIWFINFVMMPPICYTYSNSFWPWAINSEMLLYDFDLQVGQTLTYPHQRYVANIDSIQLSDGSYRRRFVFSSVDYWIEGIGSVFGLFGSFKLFDNSDLSQCKIWLNCYSQNEQTLFIDTPLPTGITCDSINISAVLEIPDTFSIQPIFSLFPNPATTSFQLNYTVTSPSQLTIYDALGRVVKELVLDASGKSITVSTDEFPVGVYLVAVTEGDRMVSGMVVVSR